jgi:small subunit ribosomal protein S20
VPNKKSAAKRVLQSERRRQRNVAAKTEIRSVIKQARLAAAAGDTEKAKELAATAESKLAKAAKRGILHINNARRRAQRLHHTVDSTPES